MTTDATTDNSVAEDLLYRQALAGTTTVQKKRKRLDPETAKLRAAENGRRSMEARRRAVIAIERLFPSEFEMLKNAARCEVDNEKGPLPGDEVQS